MLVHPVAVPVVRAQVHADGLCPLCSETFAQPLQICAATVAAAGASPPGRLAELPFALQSPGISGEGLIPFAP
eukprot:9491061-Pyramimonas_sp.AAC.1